MPFRLRDNALWKKYRGDYEFRTILTSIFSSATSAAVGGYHLFVALIARGNTTWLFTLSAYYFTLSAARIIVLLSHRMGVRKGEQFHARQKRNACNYLFGGVLLILLDITFSGIIALVTLKDFHYVYRGNMIYVMSFYAFYKVISALVKAFRSKKYNDLTVQTFRNINLADGIVSLVALQSALLFHFSSSEEGNFIRLMNAATGGAASLVLFALGWLMFIRGILALRRLSGRLQQNRVKAD